MLYLTRCTSCVPMKKTITLQVVAIQPRPMLISVIGSLLGDIYSAYNENDNSTDTLIEDSVSTQLQ